MRKITIRIVSSLTAAAVLSCTGTFFGISVSAQADVGETADGFTKKEIPTYVYSMEEKKTTECLFSDALPSMPYVDPVDYMNNIYTVEASSVKNEDGTYSVSNKNGTMKVDPNADTIFFEKYESIIMNDVNEKDTDLECKYVKELDSVYVNEDVSLTVDLSKYGIDIIENSDKVYIPLATLNDISCLTYNSALYEDENLYFVHSSQILDNGFYFDRTSFYNETERSEAMADFNYRELCFVMDNLYGLPEKAAIASSIKEMGFDKTLETYSAGTQKIKELLLSSDKVDVSVAMCLLSELFKDGGHSALALDLILQIKYYENSELLNRWTKLSENPKDEYEELASSILVELVNESSQKISPADTKKTEYEKYDVVKSWDKDDIRLYVSGNTAVFDFNGFENNAVGAFKWSLDYAEEHGVRNFVIDISTNDGGSSCVLDYMMGIITNSARDNNMFGLKNTDRFTGNVIYNPASLDLNLDGVIDDADKEVYYDFNYGILASNTSFSCGNIMPITANENGICVLGEESGGGACMLGYFYTAEGNFYAMSGPLKTYTESGRDADLGAVPDYYLVEKTTALNEAGETVEIKDYTKMYDIDAVGKLVEEFYAKKNGSADTSDVSADTDTRTDTVPAEDTEKQNETVADDTQISDSGKTNPATGNSFEGAVALMVICVMTAGAAIFAGQRQNDQHKRRR